MAVQLHGQSTWDAKAQAARKARADELYDAHKLRQDDEVRWRRRAGGAWVQGHPNSVAADGSITCVRDGKFHAVRPENLQVKTRGPRGGVNWEPLIPEEGS